MGKRPRTVEDVVDTTQGDTNMAGNNATIGGGGFHHVSMHVRDIEATLKFYTEGLGFVPKLTWGQGEKRTVLLDTGDGNYFEVSGGGSDEPGPEGTFLHLALRTTDCDTAIEKARAAGAEITVEPKDVTLPSVPPTPVRIAFFKGPDGELIELFQNEAT
jgi:glyoxylase I family protein